MGRTLLPTSTLRSATWAVIITVVVCTSGWANPLGAGILYVRKEKIAKIWQLFGDMGYADDDIRKLNHTGTHPVATDLAILDAIRFHEMIGIQRKEARLRYLQHYWTDQVRNHPKILLNTPADPQRSCGIANVGIQGIKPADLAKILMEKYKIFTVAIDYERFTRERGDAALVREHEGVGCVCGSFEGVGGVISTPQSPSTSPS